MPVAIITKPTSRMTVDLTKGSHERLMGLLDAHNGRLTRDEPDLNASSLIRNRIGSWVAGHYSNLHGIPLDDAGSSIRLTVNMSVGTMRGLSEALRLHNSAKHSNRPWLHKSDLARGLAEGWMHSQNGRGI